MAARKPRIGLIWAQFSAYHIDRVEAVGKRLAGRADVMAVEVAASSTTYAWEESGTLEHVRKQRLFSDLPFEKIARARKFWAMFKALRRCDTVFIGIAYSEPDVLALSALLRLCGVRVIMMTASKYDDRPRHAGKEWAKSLLLRPFHGAIVGGCRQHDYVRYLGFTNRPVLPGYNTVSMARVRRDAGLPARSATAWERRRFLFVGRFVEKKNLRTLLDAYARYACAAGSMARDLVLAGDGPLLADLQRQCDELGIAERVVFTGFLSAPQVAAEMAQSLALILISSEEQWGLVINEALAVGLPIVASYQVGAREALVAPLSNGYLVPHFSVEAIAAALHRAGNDEASWAEMAKASDELAWFADSERFADAVELFVFPHAEPACSDHARFAAAMLSESAMHLPQGA